MAARRSKTGEGQDGAPDLYDTKYYINRELSWLEFNRRCLEEAEDTTNPLLERVKFLAICYGNLDEFYMIRVPGIISKNPIPGPDYASVNYNILMQQVTAKVGGLVDEYSSCWNGLKEALAGAGIMVNRVDDLTPDQQAWIAEFYKQRVHPLLTPLALDVSHPFPFISNNSLNIAVRMYDKNHDILYARVKVPIGTLPRFVRIPSTKGEQYVLLEDILEKHISSLFPGLDVEGAYTFRVTRNADVKVTIDEACDFMTAVEESLEDRDIGFPVRMTVESTMPTDMVKLFSRNLKISDLQVHRTDAIGLGDLWELVGLDHPKLKEKPFEPYMPPELAEGMDMFEAIKERDWILYHPYEAFSAIVRFVNESAEDPYVQSIKICLYRIGKDPSLIKALMRAKENGKTVSVLMELRAKFDESNNIQWAREMEKIGVHVVYGPVNLKVHSKLLQVVRLEGDRLVRYTHMSSGNYNTSSAKQYADISFLTSNPELGEDVGELFNALTGYFGPRMYHHLLVAPLTLKDSLLKKIEREIEVCGRTGSGYIAMKANGLIDSDIIATLYKASMAGVKIDLNIRGLCCLRPGIPGISENIRVISIVDRFLEHSRIYYFENGGEPEMYMGSSDMMPRNLLARVEILFPVLDKKMLELIRDDILHISLSDNVKARELQPDGTYVFVQRAAGEKKIRSQKWFIDHRGCWHGSQERLRDHRIHRRWNELHPSARRQILSWNVGDSDLPGQRVRPSGEEPLFMRQDRFGVGQEERAGDRPLRGDLEESRRVPRPSVRHLRSPRGRERLRPASRRLGQRGAPDHPWDRGGQADLPRGFRRFGTGSAHHRDGHRRRQHRGDRAREGRGLVPGQPQHGRRPLQLQSGDRFLQTRVSFRLFPHPPHRRHIVVSCGEQDSIPPLPRGSGFVWNPDIPRGGMRPAQGGQERIHPEAVRAPGSDGGSVQHGRGPAPVHCRHRQEPYGHHHPRRGHRRGAHVAVRHKGDEDQPQRIEAGHDV